MDSATPQNWQDKCTFINPQNAGIPCEVGDGKMNFYPVSLDKLFELRAIAQPLAQALMTLMSENHNDSGVARGSDETGQPFEQITPPTPELAEARFRQQARAIQDLTVALTSKDNLEIVAGIIMDSLRDVFDPEDKKNWPPASEFISKVPAPVFPAMVKGLVKANEGVLGKFLGNAMSLLDRASQKVTQAAAKASPTENATENSDPSSDPQPPTEYKETVG